MARVRLTSRRRSPAPAPRAPCPRRAPTRSRAIRRRGQSAGAFRSVRTSSALPLSLTANPSPSSRTSRVTTSPMNDSVSPAGLPGMASDVRERLLGHAKERDLDLRMECDDVPRHRDVGWDSMELGPFARDIGEGVRQRPRLEGRRHRRLDRPPRFGEALAREAFRVLEVLSRSAGRSSACSAASSWATIPMSPCAIVSWISRAIRARSSRMPASRAWVSSWAWSPAFSTSAVSSLASACRRSSFCSVTFSPTASLRR